MSAPIVRIAPSPTGNLHVGTARSALFNFLYARKHGGTFIVRIEDTDVERSKKEFEVDLLEGLSWLGLTHDALYRQSERTDVYVKELERLVASGAAYLSKEASKADPLKEVEVVRLKNPGKEISFEDVIRGTITFNTKELGDLVIARSIREPLYHFAVVVDDALMEITHVLRGDDHISNTPRQILIQEALGFKRPVYGHIPLILAPDRSKMSKRAGATAVREYRELGYLPEALINYLALLGWSPGTDEEVFSLEELTERFDLEHIQTSGAIFNIEKLNWFNREHIKRLSPEQKLKVLIDYLPEKQKAMPQYSTERLQRALPHILERVSKLSLIRTSADAGEYDFYFETPAYDPSALSWKGETAPELILEFLSHIKTMLSEMDPGSFTSPSLKETLWHYADEHGRGAVLWPLRYALSGRDKSPDPFTLAEILGKDETLRRIEHAEMLLTSTHHA